MRLLCRNVASLLCYMIYLFVMFLGSVRHFINIVIFVSIKHVTNQ